MPTELRFVVSCEHGGHEVPHDFRHALSSSHRWLSTHRGYDRGTWELAQSLAAAWQAPLIANRVTRLLIDFNRSEHHPDLFSSVARLTPADRQRLLEEWYQPYRKRVADAIQHVLDAGGVAVHVSVHSFTPCLRGRVRETDVGLLYDPSRSGEASFCRRWQRRLKAAWPTACIHANRPYLGTADGLTTALRRVWPASRYFGIELEVNQRWFRRADSTVERMQAVLASTLPK